MEVALTYRRHPRPSSSYSLQQKVGFEPIRGRKIKFYTTEAWICMKTKKVMTNCPKIMQTFWTIGRHLSDILALRCGKTSRIRVQNDQGAPIMRKHANGVPEMVGMPGNGA